MALSLQRATSNGTMVSLALSIDYFSRNDLTVYIGGVIKAPGSGWNWVGTTDKTISFSPAVANGVEVLIKRSTDLSAPRNEYTKGAQFVSETLDENFRQSLYAVQEAKEGSVLSEIFNDLDAHGYVIRNIGAATLPGDAVSLAQYQADTLGAFNYKQTAVAAAAAALASQSAASTSEGNALSSKNAAATSASNASTSEGNALSSKNAAATSASNAATSETNALASKNSAATSLSTFQNQYQGPKAAAPTLRTDNSALQIGDLYFDTTTGMRVYTATGWASAGSSVNGTAKRGSIVATAGQTVFPILGGFDSGFIDVYLDGVKLVNAVDVTVNASPNVTLAIGALAGQTLDYVAYGTFSVANTYDQATIDAKANTQQYRNRLTNGAMVVGQRRAINLNVGGNAVFGPDRWILQAITNGGTFQTQQTNSAPPMPFSAMFQAYLDTANASTVTEFVARQWVESQFVKDLAGKKATLSFWYKSALTGQHAATITTNYGSYGVVGGTSIAMPFTVNAADTWEYKTLTFDAFLNITSWGTLPDNMVGAIVDIGFKSGAYGKSSLVLGNYFQMTGVQLEAGSVATPFEFRPYPVELVMCQRYYWQGHLPLRGFSSGTSTFSRAAASLPVRMRVAPSIGIYGSPTGWDGNSTATVNSITATITTPDTFEFDGGVAGTVLTTGRMFMVVNNSLGGFYASAEQLS